MITAILNIFFTNLIVCTTCLSLGTILLKKFKINQDFGNSLVFGVIFISHLGLFLNFIIPINKIVTFTTIPILLFNFFLQKRIKKNLSKLIIISVFSVFFYFTGNNAEDYSIYHLINLQAITQYKTVLGLIHVKLNLGQSPITFYGDAIFQNLFFIKYNLNYLSFVTLAGIFFIIYDILKKKKLFNFSDYFLIVSIIYFIIKFSRLGSHGADFISPALITLGLFYFLKINFKKFRKPSNYELVCLSIIFISNAYFFKIFSIIFYILVFIIFFYIIKNNLLKKYRSLLIIIILLNFLFFLKNILVSGCILFPISETCFNQFSWTMEKSKIQDWKQINEAWTKGWYNHFSLNYNEYILSFNWLNTWINNHFIKSLEKIFLPLLVVILVIKILKKKIIYKKNFNLNMILIFIVSSISSLLWFLHSPLIRLGLPGLLPLIIFIFNYNFLKDFKFMFPQKKIIFILLPCFFLLKNTYRISNTSFDYENFPYPRINKNSSYIIDKNKIKIRIENNVKYSIYEGEKCYTVQFPCLTNKKKEKSFSFNKKFGYLILKKLY
jgi:hypothetical protein